MVGAAKPSAIPHTQTWTLLEVVTAQRFRCVTRDIVQLKTERTLGVGGGRFDLPFVLSSVICDVLCSSPRPRVAAAVAADARDRLDMTMQRVARLGPHP